MLKIACDLCGVESANPELYALLAGPYSNAANATGHADIHMPQGWEKVRGKHVCERCLLRLEDFMRPIPKIMAIAKQ